MLIYLIIIIMVILDQLFKILIERNLVLGQSHPVIEGVFHLTYVQNPGAAFGFFKGYNEILIVLTLIIIIGFLYIFHNYLVDSLLLKISFGLIISGGIGNLIDRIRLGYVIDYLDFRIWPVFNLADMIIVIGTVLFIIYLFLDNPVLKNKDFNLI